ncbi:TPA: transposase, partial [Klebsiella variicola]|nr:transposase [Klebsiella variicola]
MKRSRFTDSQIIIILKQAEVDTPIPELCREHGISSVLTRRLTLTEILLPIII